MRETVGATRRDRESHWVLALGSLAWRALSVLVDAHVVAWTLDGYVGHGSTRSHALQLGPHRSGG